MGGRQRRDQGGTVRDFVESIDVQAEVKKVICFAMEYSQLPLVRSASGACDAWSRLEDHFKKNSLASKLLLRRRFFTTMMEEGDDVLGHINKL